MPLVPARNSRIMMSTSDIRSLTMLDRNARQAVAGAFEALAEWRREVNAANERYLTKALDRMAKAQRAIGWPEQATAAARESLIEASKAQTRVIDRIVDAWERQLKSPHDPAGVPKALRSPMTALPAAADPVSEMMRMGEMALVPFKLWMQAAEAWQRNWASAMAARAGRPPATGPVKAPRERARRARSR
jgi:hypothetical protein